MRAFLLLALSLALSGCAAQESGGPTPTREPDGPTLYGVDIRAFTFVPADLTISAGDGVEWFNDDGVAHTATADDGAFDTGRLERGARRAIEPFAEPGRFGYHCSIHPWMTGTIVVT